MEARKIAIGLVVVLLLLCVVGSAYSRTRDEVINEAAAYANLSWTCHNTYGTKYLSGQSYTGEAYWSAWNGWDTRPNFINKVEVQELLSCHACIIV
ncbi:MAG: hypothetical protein V1800_13585 [Candidatus Latescibacterota bacterium]